MRLVSKSTYLETQEELVGQTFLPHEIIIIDDGSKDNSYNEALELIRDYNIQKKKIHEMKQEHSEFTK